MSESDQMFLFVKIDDTEFDRQSKKLQESMNKVGTAFSGAVRPATESIKKLQDVNRSFTETAKGVVSSVEQMPKPASRDFDKNVPRMTAADVEHNRKPQSVMQSTETMKPTIASVQSVIDKLTQGLGSVLSKIPKIQKSVEPMRAVASKVSEPAQRIASSVGQSAQRIESGVTTMRSTEEGSPMQQIAPKVTSFGSTGEKIPKPAGADFDRNMPRMTAADVSRSKTTTRTDDTSKSTSNISSSVSSISTLVKNIQNTFSKITSSVGESFTKVTSMGKVLEPITKSASSAGKSMTGSVAGSRDKATLTNLNETVEPMRKASAGIGKTMSSAMEVAKMPSLTESIEPMMKAKSGVTQAMSGVATTAKPVSDTVQKFDKLIHGTEQVKKTVETTGGKTIENQAKTGEKSGKGLSGLLGELKSIGGGILPLIGIGASIAGIAAMVVQASPLLRSIFSILNTGIMFMLRPIGDFIGFLLRPVAIMFLRFAIQFYRDVFPTIKSIGQAGGAALAKFFSDPVGALAGLGLWIVQSFMNDAGIQLIKTGITNIAEGIVSIVAFFSGGIGNIGESITGAFEGFSWPEIDFEWPTLEGLIDLNPFVKLAEALTGLDISKMISDALTSWKWPKMDFKDSKPDWLDSLLTFVWPERPDWLDDLIGWVMPVMLVPDWIRSLVDGTWEWPKVPDWIIKLVNWLFPGVPHAIDLLLNWEWPKIELPKWLKDFLGIKDEPKKGIADTRTAGEKKSDSKGITNKRSEQIESSVESIKKMKESFGIVTETANTISRDSKQSIEPSWKAVSFASNVASMMAKSTGSNMGSASSSIASAAKKIAKMRDDLDNDLKKTTSKKTDTDKKSVTGRGSKPDSSSSKSTIDTVKETANRGISLANKFAGTNIRKLAKGGVISELVKGIGVSGQQYTFGEQGEEVIIPMTKLKTIVQKIQDSSKSQTSPINRMLRNGMDGAQRAMRNDYSNMSSGSSGGNSTKTIHNHVTVPISIGKIDSQIDVDKMIERVMKEVYVMLSSLKS